jgi:hypothetical protein
LGGFVFGIDIFIGNWLQAGLAKFMSRDSLRTAGAFLGWFLVAALMHLISIYLYMQGMSDGAWIKLSSRYFYPGASILLVCIAIFDSALGRRRRMAMAAGSVALLGLAGLTFITLGAW